MALGRYRERDTLPPQGSTEGGEYLCPKFPCSRDWGGGTSSSQVSTAGGGDVALAGDEGIAGLEGDEADGVMG